MLTHEHTAAERANTSARVGVQLRSIVDIIADLKLPIPEQYLEQRVQGGQEITFWPWSVGVRAFDHYAPGWQSEIRHIICSEGHVGVGMRIYIPCLECPSPGLFREDLGGDYEHPDMAKRARGFDPFLDAKAQALKRAMSQWGFGLYLYNDGGGTNGRR